MKQQNKTKQNEPIKLELAPQDYIVFNGGLKVENTSKDLFMVVELESYEVMPMIQKYKKAKARKGK